MKPVDSRNQNNYEVGTILVFFGGDIGIVKKKLEGLCNNDHPVRKVLIFGEKNPRTMCTCCAIPLGSDQAILATLSQGGEA